MKILIWGLGYVGSVTAACLAKLGHEVVGIDSNSIKVAAIDAGQSPIKEPGLETLIEQTRKSGKLAASADGASLVAESDVSIVCVGTPSDSRGSLKIDAVKHVISQIGNALKHTNRSHAIVLRSTVPVGTTRKVLAPLIERESGRKLGDGLDLVFNPEFLREATAIADFEAPPYTIVGILGNNITSILSELFAGVVAPLHEVAVEEAEMLKVVGNAFHGLKAAFANEIGRICRSVDVDGAAVMRLICADTKLNISSAYLKPGFAFGGSCLPKDIRAINSLAAANGVKVPVLNSVMPSNSDQIAETYEIVRSYRPQCVAVLGLGFKPHTDDVRESPVLNLIEDLRRDGLRVLVHDPDIDATSLLGANGDYLRQHLQDAETILVGDDKLDQADCFLITQKRERFAEIVDNARRDRTAVAIVDVAGCLGQPE